MKRAILLHNYPAVSTQTHSSVKEELVCYASYPGMTSPCTAIANMEHLRVYLKDGIKASPFVISV